MRQFRWVDLIVDYDCTIYYHPDKANVVVNALSGNSSSLISHLKVSYISLLIDLRSLGADLAVGQNRALLAYFQLIKYESRKIKIKGKEQTTIDFSLRDYGASVIGSRLCVPNNSCLKNQILEEACSLAYANHLGSTKMYRTLREHY